MTRGSSTVTCRRTTGSSARSAGGSAGRRLHGSLAKDGIVLPLLACCLILALIAGTLLTVFTADLRPRYLRRRPRD